MSDFNLKAKKNSITSIGLGQKSFLRAAAGSGNGQTSDAPRKVHTVASLPKTFTIMPSGTMQQIDEESETKERGTEKDLDLGDSDDSESIGGECDDEDLEALENAAMGKPEEKKSMEDLIDKELTELLKVCKNLRPPMESELIER